MDSSPGQSQEAKSERVELQPQPSSTLPQGSGREGAGAPVGRSGAGAWVKASSVPFRPGATKKRTKVYFPTYWVAH